MRGRTQRLSQPNVQSQPFSALSLPRLISAPDARGGTGVLFQSRQGIDAGELREISDTSPMMLVSDARRSGVSVSMMTATGATFLCVNVKRLSYYPAKIYPNLIYGYRYVSRFINSLVTLQIPLDG
ncbi:hypothetical protein SAMN04515618_10625 [Collimonas sp. OK307]|uniref:hypothetical protein n=1 Tax=Collimonas sp. OK307 TaxID=1801620 RepID=UPI0008F42E2D|nr:hypothetical protein [Collimonas sp. OK307]SFH93377.1 hypothetical protein SAMN04515618_10625 [Collimonas sp. OK307]